MHRSGTSYLAQTLSLLGLELPLSVQPGAEDNPKGHFEPFFVAEYHESLLTDMNLSWDTFISPTENWFSSEYADKAIGELSDKIKSDYPGAGPIVLKDPRVCLFLPLWKKVVAKLGLQDFYLIPFRHPLEVAASLEKRNTISKNRSLLIWLDYLFDAEKNSRKNRRCFIQFPNWALDIKQTISKIEFDLGTGFPNKNKKNLLIAEKEYEEAFVHNKKLRTEKATNDIEKLALDTYDCFIRLLIDPLDSATLTEIDNLRDKFVNLSDLFVDVLNEHELKLEQQLQVSQDHGEQANARVNTLQQQLTDSEGRTVELEQQLQTQVTSNKELQIEINSLKLEGRALAKEYARLVATYNNEKLTVIKPIYRNIYKATGLALRKTMPSSWVESLKKFTPNPDGIAKRLEYKFQSSDRSVAPSDLFMSADKDSRPDIFVLSIINWDFRYQRPQHIAKGLADNGRRVFYVEMELADRELQLTKASDNLYCARLCGKNIGHIQTYTGQPDPKQVKQWIAAFYQLCDAVGSTAYKQVIVQHPFWWQFARHLSPEFQIIFDCMDDISGFSNTEQFLLDLEYDLLTKCDRLIVSSKYLFNKYEHYKKPVLVRNAAELKHFTQPVKDLVRPAFLGAPSNKDKRNVIKVGYVGAIAEWFDADLIEEVAKKEPGFDFHFCGAVTASEPKRLEQVENIHLHGEISYSDVPGFLHEMDVLIIPFKIIPIIQACDPVKFYEYSATGKPTVTTSLPELTRASDLTFFATTPSEFSDQIHNAYKRGKARNFQKQLREYAANNTWRHRTDQFMEVLESVPKVSIVILSYGDPELTKAALSSLYERGPSYPNLEIIIVDNGSPPDAVLDIRKFSDRYPNVSMIENGENLGFAKGNNVGLEAATGEYIMLLNNDTVVTPGAIHAMVRHLDHNPIIGVIGPLTNNIGNEAKLFVGYEDMEQMRSVARSATIGYRGVFTPIPVVAYFAAMFRRKDLKRFGMLPENYGRGMFEDDDHCASIKSKGFLCVLAEDAYIHHHLSATFSTLKEGEREKLFEKNKRIYEQRWGKWQPHNYREHRPKSSLDL